MLANRFLSTVSLDGVILTLILTAGLAAQPTSDYDIYVLNPNTGVTQRVTSIPGSGEFNPAFSRNGHLILHDVKGATTHDLYVTELSTGVSTPLPGGSGGNDGAWSGNGRYIAFDGVQVADSSVYIIPSGGGTRSLVRTDAMDADWSPNSKFLVFTDVTDESLRTIELATGIENTIAPEGVNGVWSPNGEYIAFTDSSALYVVRVDSNGAAVNPPVQLTFDGPTVFNQQPTWSRNGKQLAFHSNRGSVDFDIWTIAATGGTPTLLTGLLGAGDYDPAFSRGGPKMIAYAAVGVPPAAVAGKATPAGVEVSTYPNPFNPSTTISVTLTNEAYTTVKVYDMLGKEVAVLVEGTLNPGTHAFTWQAQDMPSGTYLYRLEAGDKGLARTLTLVK